MNHKEFADALISKGYTPYLVAMFDRMLSDLESRSDELSQLTSVKITVEVSI